MNRVNVFLFAIALTIGLVGSAAAQTGSATFVLSSNDYAHIGPGQPVDCPSGKCKDLFYSTRALSAPAGKTITSVEIISRIPADQKQNHWYRCGGAVSCGSVAEFSDLNDHARSCIGTPACMVWRATDGRTGGEIDTIRITWQ
jgi:hypothetical protein